jgi:hypothetical protein
MKLLRFGEAGKEKPGVLLNDEIVDVSSFGEDFGETFFTNDGISRLASWFESRKACQTWCAFYPSFKDHLCRLELQQACRRVKDARALRADHFL